MEFRYMNYSTLTDTLIDKLKKILQFNPNWALVPVNGNKAPYNRDWLNKTFSIETIISEINSGKSKGYGLKTGKISGGILAIDCDGVAAHELAEKLGGLPKTVTFSSGKNGRAQYLYKVPEQYWDGISTKKLKTGVKEDGKEVQLELRWDGCQSVLPPSAHPETGEYKWIIAPNKSDIAECPMWFIEQMVIADNQAVLPVFKEEKQQYHQPDNNHFNDKDWALSYLNAISSYRAEDYNEWLKIGAALKAVNDDLLTDWENWSSQSPKFKPGECQRKWDSFKRNSGNTIGIGTLAYFAKLDGWKSPFAGVSQREKSGVIRVVKRASDSSEPEDDFEAEFNETPKLKRAFEKAKHVIGDRIRLNLMNHDVELDGEVLDLECLELELALEMGLELKIGTKQLEAIVLKIAKINSYNPIKDYLEQCHARHSNTGILDTIAERYFQAKDEIYQVYVRKMLISAVARIYEPGCKQDDALILQSKDQGIGKSQFFRILAGDEYFCDDMGDFKEKDEKLKMHQNWILEWAELETITGKKMAGQVKSFLATKEDQIRPPYARKAVKMKRQSVIVGTANPVEILFDPTGNRRSWVIPVKGKIPLNLLREERDQIWGAAVELYKSGEIWWLSQGEQSESNTANKKFQAGSFIEDEIEDYLEGRNDITTRELINYVESLGIKIESPQALRAVESQIKSAVIRCKWEPCRLFIDGKRPRGYKRPTDPPLPLTTDPLIQTPDIVDHNQTQTQSQNSPTDPLIHQKNDKNFLKLETVEQIDLPPQKFTVGDCVKLTAPFTPQDKFTGKTGLITQINWDSQGFCWDYYIELDDLTVVRLEKHLEKTKPTNKQSEIWFLQNIRSENLTPSQKRAVDVFSKCFSPSPGCYKNTEDFKNTWEKLTPTEKKWINLLINSSEFGAKFITVAKDKYGIDKTYLT